ncbi:MAG: DNA polymerase III subunit gamma/tau, partial [Streptococcus mitis]|nr:DNA polymerase III subunit gamma/tau [Streptococcus mitis]
TIPKPTSPAPSRPAAGKTVYRVDRNKVQYILQEAVENPDLARQNLIRLQNAWGEVIESLGGPDKALLVGSQPVAANEHHAILAFESNFNAGQTMKRDNLNTMFGNILSQAAGFSPEILAISMEEWKEVRAAFSAKAKSSQAEKEAEESLIPEGFEFLADKVKVEED